MAKMITEVLKTFVAPVVFGFLSYVLTAKLDDWKNRRKHSRLGGTVMDSLIEEVTTGISILTNFQSSDTLPISIMPTKSWNGQSTISDEVLLRIIEVSENITPDHFPPQEIRIHCKNYFDIICSQWNNNLRTPKNDEDATKLFIMAKNIASSGSQTFEGSQGVLKMLMQTRLLLQNNSRKILPK